MKTILITGAAGDIGTHLRRELAGRYRLRLSDVKPIASLAAGEEFMRADISVFEELAEVTRGVDAIVHLGGFSVEGPWETILSANIVGTRNVFESARAAFHCFHGIREHREIGRDHGIARGCFHIGAMKYVCDLRQSAERRRAIAAVQEIDRNMADAARELRSAAGYRHDFPAADIT